MKDRVRHTKRSRKEALRSPHAIGRRSQSLYHFQLRPPWWFHPLVPALLIFPPVLWIAFLTSPEDYRLLWRTEKYVDLAALAAAGALFSTFVVGVTLGATKLVAKGRTKRTPPPARLVKVNGRDLRFLDHIAGMLFTIVMLAYVVWVIASVLRGATPGHVLAAITLQPGAISEFKTYARPIGGVTTLTQFAPVVMAIWTLLWRIGYNRRIWGIAILLLVTMARTLLYAERLAFLEIIIPAVLIVMVVRGGTLISRAARVVTQLAPVIAIPLLWLFFAIFEYTRSWTYYRLVMNVSYPEFVTQRLLGYYTTSINNSVLYRDRLEWVHHDPYASFPAAWEFPLLKSLFPKPQIGGIDSGYWWSETLHSLANPEFNNVGSFLVPLAEIGPIGAFICWLILGVYIGVLYRTLRSGSVIGLITYSCSFIGLLELPRFTYWVQGRYFPVLLSIPIILVLIQLRSWSHRKGTRSRRTNRNPVPQRV